MPSYFTILYYIVMLEHGQPLVYWSQNIPSNYLKQTFLSKTIPERLIMEIRNCDLYLVVHNGVLLLIMKFHHRDKKNKKQIGKDEQYTNLNFTDTQSFEVVESVVVCCSNVVMISLITYCKLKLSRYINIFSGSQTLPSL